MQKLQESMLFIESSIYLIWGKSCKLINVIMKYNIVGISHIKRGGNSMKNRHFEAIPGTHP